MGKAENWQDKIIRLLKNETVTILSPRRDDWDSSWVQKIENNQFREQVEWELHGQENSDVIPVYFDPQTKSVITMLEIGLFNRKCIICCPEPFWRKGNVDIICERYGIPQAKDLDALAKLTIQKLRRNFNFH